MPDGEIRFTAAGAALFRLLGTLDSLERARPEGLASRARLGLLRRLARRGPQTMSALARDRGASRQGVQRLSQALVREGSVELLANPRHRRAPLLALTSQGQELYRELARAEAEALNRLATGLEAGELHAATRLLRRVLARSGA